MKKLFPYIFLELKVASQSERNDCEPREHGAKAAQGAVLSRRPRRGPGPAGPHRLTVAEMAESRPIAVGGSPAPETQNQEAD